MIKKPKTSLKGLNKAVCSKTETGTELSSLENPTIQQRNSKIHSCLRELVSPTPKKTTKFLAHLRLGARFSKSTCDHERKASCLASEPVSMKWKNDLSPA